MTAATLDKIKPPTEGLGALLKKQRVIVCCGAGGVGKTTTAAALSLAAAREGRRVLVLTIDPSKRLAETLGVARNPPKPVPLPPDRMAAAGIKAPGNLETWMLDPKLVADESVRRLTGNEEDAQRIMKNRVYQQATSMVAGLHEYTAMEALYQFITGGQYDLVVLDTPPSRNALDFLDAPARLGRFLDGTIFKMFLPKEGGMINKAAAAVLDRVLRTVFGDDFAAELTSFFSAFSGIFAALNGDLARVRELLSAPDVAFLLVSSPAPAALTEAHFFHDKIAEMKLPFRGFILNRSRANTDGMIFPEDTLINGNTSAAAKSALEKLQAFARVEQLQAKSDQGLVADLALRAGSEAVVVAVPNLPTGADDMSTLLTVADVLARS